MILEVAVPYPIDKTLSYQSETPLPFGSLVSVNLRRKNCFAFVLNSQQKASLPYQVKPINEILLNQAIFDDNFYRFLCWVSEYYSYPLGETLATAFPKDILRRLIKSPELLKKEETPSEENISQPHTALSEEQTNVWSQIKDKMNKPHLIKGVTGSGKTEVYIQALYHQLLQGKSCLYLVPEIALTPELIIRLESHFGKKLVLLHSSLTPKQRANGWVKCYQSESIIAVGTRSSIFAPMNNLGLIIVDEEHDTSFKQEDGLRYSARDLAIVRAKINKAQVILGSATPSLETLYNANIEKYHKHELLNQYHPPQVQLILVDLKKKKELVQNTPWLSQTLFEEIENNLTRGEQSLLFLNRLGYAHMLFCLDCGHSWKCPHCDINLTYYAKLTQLKCHHCLHVSQLPELCPECQSYKLKTLGLGTEQVESTISSLFPEARILRFDRSTIKSHKTLKIALSEISNNNCDIIIGTQMIAKGHNFRNLTLVGILLADASLQIPDFRASERSYQLFKQVSGRAGRFEKPAQIIFQTFTPEASIFQNLLGTQDEQFVNSELGRREALYYPPYYRMTVVKIRGKNLEQVKKLAITLSQKIQAICQNHHVQLLGPSEAPLARINDHHRWHFLLKYKSRHEVTPILKLIKQHNTGTSTHLAIDVDPYHLL